MGNPCTWGGRCDGYDMSKEDGSPIVGTVVGTEPSP